MTSDYETYVQQVLAEVPGADSAKVTDAFVRYEKDFLIPPADALRSVLRRFQGEHGIVETKSKSTGGSSQRSAPPVKKVEKLSELSADDKNVEIEVEIATHNPRTTMVRGEEKVVPYGLLEDQPRSTSGNRTRWEYKDWGNSPNLAPGAIVRIEGASVNEYQGRMSLNINQSTRVVILEKGTRTVFTPGEPTDINLIKNDGQITVVGRLLASRNDVINRRDGSGTIDVVRGRIADDTGAIGFLSWEPFEHEVGSLIKIENAQVRTFRDTPEINIGSSTRVEIFHDTNFASSDELSAQAVSKIEDLRDGSRDVDIIVEVQKMIKRTFKGSEGEEKHVWSGDVADPTGRCRCSIWSEPPFDLDSLPIVIRLSSVRVRAWQGIPDITIDGEEQIEILAAAPWGGDIDLVDNTVEVSLPDLVGGPSRVGISTTGTVVSVREDCGIITRCSECRRVLRDGECATHGAQDGESDVRMRLVLDDSGATISLIINKEGVLSLLGKDQKQIQNMIRDDGQMVFVQGLREQFLGRKMNASGRTIVDDQGAMLLCDEAEVIEVDAGLIATELRTLWGVA